MTPRYGYVKCKVVSEPKLTSKYLPHQHETQYHLHVTLEVAGGGTGGWDTAINVGTDDSDDLLKFKVVYDFQHPVRTTLAAADPGLHELTDTHDLPALDFLRTDVLAGTGPWRDSDVMDGGKQREPYASLAVLLEKARAKNADVYVFGRLYDPPEHGIHDVAGRRGPGGLERAGRAGVGGVLHRVHPAVRPDRRVGQPGAR
jgi:hypothetical protein